MPIGPKYGIPSSGDSPEPEGLIRPEGEGEFDFSVRESPFSHPESPRMEGQSGKRMKSITVMTECREELIDITDRIRAHIRTCLPEDASGALALYCPHTTCGLTINEGADPDVARDMTAFFSRLVPHTGNYRHREGNSDAHIKACLLGSSLLVLVDNGRLLLGTWQSIYLYEGDGPRTRNLWLQWLPGEAD